MDLCGGAVFGLCPWVLAAVPEVGGALMCSSFIDVGVRGEREVNFEPEPGVSSYDSKLVCDEHRHHETAAGEDGPRARHLEPSIKPEVA